MIRVCSQHHQHPAVPDLLLLLLPLPPLLLVANSSAAGPTGLMCGPHTSSHLCYTVTQVSAVHTAAAKEGLTLKTVLISILLPTGRHMQHGHHHLPFRLVLPFQVAGFLVAVLWPISSPAEAPARVCCVCGYGPCWPLAAD